MTAKHRLPPIELATESDRKVATQDLLLDVLRRYDLDRWFCTDRVRR